MITRITTERLFSGLASRKERSAIHKLSGMGIGALLMISCISQAEESNRILEVGIAVTDITPKDPVWLAGYAARDQPIDRN